MVSTTSQEATWDEISTLGFLLPAELKLLSIELAFTCTKPRNSCVYNVLL